MKYLKKIQSLPEEKRKRIIWAIIIVLFIFFFAILVLNFHPKEENQGFQNIFHVEQLKKEIRENIPK